ncbi:MAG TPA: sodium:proton exchanger [Spirochaetia bacterium]|nr:MAG: sodium:proton exchanger [Spirochaetes bacterium GWB1_36_13]HCL58128.1 sodium:proton exchanger [Spirochaetia bacterium]
MIDFLILIAGFFPLIYGANFLVDSASSIAKRHNIPNMVIGLSIVAFGTSAPELVVNLFASVEGSSQIALGNILGSNIFNILGILGISALVYPLTVKTNTTWIEIPLSLMSAVLIFFTANDAFFEKRSFSEISFIDGIVYLFLFIIFLAYIFNLMKQGNFEEEIEIKEYKTPMSVFLFFSGLILLVAGSKMIVYGASGFAKTLGISERIIALTIISAGTSLPELATSFMAARKKNVDLAVGNIVGSNIFNVFLILGISALVNPLALQPESHFDILVNIFSSLLLFIFVFTGKGRKIDRWEGGVFLSLYIAYITYLIIK